MAYIQSGDGSSTLLKVDPVSNAARVSLYHSDGVEVVATNNDYSATGLFSGIPAMGASDNQLKVIRTDKAGSIATAWGNLLFSEIFGGTTINPTRWNIIATTMAATQASATGILLNSGSITTVSTGYLLKSFRTFYKIQKSPMNIKFRAAPNIKTNSVMEFGLGDATTFNGAHTTGIFWQSTSAGTFQLVLINNSGNIYTSPEITSTAFDGNSFFTFDIAFDDDRIMYQVQNSASGQTIAAGSTGLPVGAARFFSSSALSVFARLYNTSSAPAAAPTLRVSDVSIISTDVEQLRSTNQIYSTIERSSIVNPFTGAQAATNANSAEPTSATLSNTAAGYTTLGGKFQFAAVAGAATDYCLFGYQIPAPSNFNVTRVTIDTWNTGAAAATTPTLLTWSIGHATAVSLATTNAVRIGLGAQQIPVGTAIGGMADRSIDRKFDTPLHVASGRFLQIILRMPVGTATASQVIAGMVNVYGYFD